mmetsp:Transcript_9984/g.19708  ORF Transcript_9984/g.19708 Transcript_9984/m.19708 type:complete len:371 (+) Transcript_9984:322-1434(+)
MTRIIRKGASVLFYTAVLLSPSGRSNGGSVAAFGVQSQARAARSLRCAAVETTHAIRVPTKPHGHWHWHGSNRNSNSKSCLCMQSDTHNINNNINSNNNNNNSYRRNRNRNTARKSSLVDHPSSSASSNSGTTGGGEGIRSRVQSFLRTKNAKATRSSSKFVQEVTDIDAIKRLLSESKGTAAYTAVIFHAPYCKACKASMPLFEKLAKKYTSEAKKQQTRNQWNQQKSSSWLASSKPALPREDSQQPTTSTTATISGTPHEPSVRFLSVPVTQENAEQLQDRFGVTKFPLAHIYDPTEGLVDERPVLRKLFSGFEERLASVVVSSSSSTTTSSTTSGDGGIEHCATAATTANVNVNANANANTNATVAI